LRKTDHFDGTSRKRRRLLYLKKVRNEGDIRLFLFYWKGIRRSRIVSDIGIENCNGTRAESAGWKKKQAAGANFAGRRGRSEPEDGALFVQKRVNTYSFPERGKNSLSTR